MIDDLAIDLVFCDELLSCFDFFRAKKVSTELLDFVCEGALLGIEGAFSQEAGDPKQHERWFGCTLDSSEELSVEVKDDLDSEGDMSTSPKSEALEEVVDDSEISGALQEIIFVVEINSIGADILGRIEPLAKDRFTVRLLVGPEGAESDDFRDLITVSALARDILVTDESVY